MRGWLGRDGEDTILRVWVVPGAKREGVVGVHGDAVKVRVAAPPEAGRANRAVVELIGRLLGARVHLETGRTGRSKQLRVVGMTPEEVAERLSVE